MKTNFRLKKQSAPTAKVFSEDDLVFSRSECNVLHVHLMFYASLDSDVFTSNREKETELKKPPLKGSNGCVELSLQ